LVSLRLTEMRAENARNLGQVFLVRRSRSPRRRGGGPSPKAGVSIRPPPFLWSAGTTPLTCSRRYGR